MLYEKDQTVLGKYNSLHVRTEFYYSLIRGRSQTVASLVNKLNLVSRCQIVASVNLTLSEASIFLHVAAVLAAS